MPPNFCLISLKKETTETHKKKEFLTNKLTNINSSIDQLEAHIAVGSLQWFIGTSLKMWKSPNVLNFGLEKINGKF